jgi:Helicase conserved C-terminal domain
MTTQETIPSPNQLGQQFESVLGVDGIGAQLSSLGIRVPNNQQREVIKTVLSSENCLISSDFAVDEWAYVFIPLVVEVAVNTSSGVSIVVTNEGAKSTLVKKLKKSELTWKEASALAAASGGFEGSLICGTAQEIREFFQHEVSRATEISRVFLVDLDDSDIESLDELLGTATKRARRPQFIVKFSQPLSPELENCLKAHFQLPKTYIEHLYYEVDGELLSKPTALADFIEGERPESVLIYANQPSDADFIEVMLRKRTITCQKLIGNVTSQRSHQAMTQAKAGKIKALVVTDISSRHLDPHEFELIVNYSIPSDPEVYVHRTESAGSGDALRRVISLVGPLDRANFHYLQKIVETSFSEMAPPSTENLAQSRFESLKAEAISSVKGISENVRKLAGLVCGDQSREDIVAFLITSLQSVKSAITVSAEEETRRSRSPERGERAHDRDSSHRSNRRNDGRRDRDNRGYNEGDEATASHGDSDDSRSSNRRNQNQRVEKPTQRICRIYVEGKEEGGLSPEFFEGVVAKHYPEVPSPVVRISQRPRYTFLDILDEQTDGFIAELENTGGPQGEQLFVRKAINLSIPLEGDEQNGGRSEESYSDNPDDSDEISLDEQASTM